MRDEAGREKVVEVVIETPKGSGVKIKYIPDRQLYELDRILPEGFRFPFNFGFVPNTRAADGDPLDVVLILDAPLFPGCRIRCRFLGVLQATQTERGSTYRNDRILAVAEKDKEAPESLSDLSKNFVSNIASFFRFYHELDGNRFEMCGVGSAQEAIDLLR